MRKKNVLGSDSSEHSVSSDQGMTVKQLAERLNTSEGAIHQRVRRTRQGLGDFPMPENLDGKLVWDTEVIDGFLKKLQGKARAKPAAKQHAGNRANSPTSSGTSKLIVPDSQVALPSNVIEPANTGKTSDSPALARLIASKDIYANTSFGKKNLSTIQVDKPFWQYFFRIRPGSEWQIELATLERRDGLWLIEPEYIPHVRKVSYRVFRLGVYHDKAPFLWGLKTGYCTWNVSAAEASEIAIDHWVRLESDDNNQQYIIEYAKKDYGEPEWPDKPFEEIVLEWGFRDRIVDCYDHPVLRQLRGEI